MAIKKSAFEADSLMRRPVGSNHIPYDGTNWMLIKDQIRLISASPYLRNINYSDCIIKNNTSISEDVVSGSVSGNTALINTQLHHSKPRTLVNGNQKL